MNGIKKRRATGNERREGREPVGEVFSESWMREYARIWNAEQAMVRELTRQRFTAVIGYGFPDQAVPKSMMVVTCGLAEHAGRYDGRNLDWDLRAAPMDWTRWLNQGFDLSTILVEVGANRLQIWKGDHKRILRKPPLVGALLRAFALMLEVRVDTNPAPRESAGETTAGGRQPSTT